MEEAGCDRMASWRTALGRSLALKVPAVEKYRPRGYLQSLNYVFRFRWLSENLITGSQIWGGGNSRRYEVNT